MALRSPTQFHSFWGPYATVSLPTSGEVQVGDTAFDATLGQLVVCTAVGPVVWTPVGGGVTGVTASAPLASSGGATPDISVTAGSAINDVLAWDGAQWVSTAPPLTQRVLDSGVGGTGLWCYYSTLNALNTAPASGATSPNWTGSTPPTSPQVVSAIPVP